MNEFIKPVALEKAYRLLNIGPTVLVSARAQGVSNVMAASWVCALDFAPPKVTVVLDKATRTRALIEQSGEFILQIPTVRQRELVYRVGSVSLADDPDKLAHCGVELFDGAQGQGPLVQGCSAWLSCRVIPEPHNQSTYDLFIGEVTAAWADSRIFRDGHWQFETADPQWRTLHHVAGGHFYAIGEALAVPEAVQE